MVTFVHKDKNTGRKKGIVHIKGDLDFPMVIADRHQKCLYVTSEWDWWLDDRRFMSGLTPSMAVVDARGVSWTVVHVGDDGKHGPILSTEKCSYDIEAAELRELLKEGCDKLGWTQPDTDQLVTLADFSAAAIEAWVQSMDAERDNGERLGVAGAPPSPSS